MKKLLFLRFFVLAAVICLATPAFTSAADSNPLEPIGAIGEYMTDAAATVEIKVRLAAEKDLDASQISVTTTDLVVQLDGTVDSAAQFETAERVARSLSNVKGVKNHLKIRQ